MKCKSSLCHCFLDAVCLFRRSHILKIYILLSTFYRHVPKQRDPRFIIVVTIHNIFLVQACCWIVTVIRCRAYCRHSPNVAVTGCDTFHSWNDFTHAGSAPHTALNGLDDVRGFKMPREVFIGRQAHSVCHVL